MPLVYLPSKSMLKRVGSFNTIVFHKNYLQSCLTILIQHVATVMFFCFGKKHSRRLPPNSAKQQKQVKNSKSILCSLTNKEEEKC